jgi:hypothetical protein
VTVDDLGSFLALNGVTPLGIRGLEAHLPRWVSVLESRGVTEVSDVRLADKWTPAQHDDYIQIVALLSQASQAAHKRLKIPRKLERMLAEHAHQYRDIARVRELGDPERGEPHRM